MSQVQRIFLSVAVVAALAAAYGLGRHSASLPSAGKTGRRILFYADPMHPAYKSDKPGIAPDCGMKLEPVYAENPEPQKISSLSPALPPGTVSIDGATQQVMGIRLAPVEKNSANHSVRVVGRVVPEDTRVYRVNSGLDGFIRETFQDSVGTRVKKDQKLASYYSPDFLAVASGFLAATERVPGSVGNDGSRTIPFPGTVSKQGVSSLQGYTDRLRNLGMSDAQIKHMADTRLLPESVDILAPADGFILSRNISPGLHFEHGMEFYRIADLRHVWVVAEVDEPQASFFRPGTWAKVYLDRGHAVSARISDSLPQSEVGGGTVKLRLDVDNPGLSLRPDVLVDVELPMRLPPGVTVPLDALIESGASSRIYVARGDGVFEPREVETGWRYGGQVEIRKGILPGERVVVAATFLVDSESRLKSPASAQAPSTLPPTEKAAEGTAHLAATKMVKDPSCGMAVDPVKATGSGNILAVHGLTYYFCSEKCKQKFQSDSALIASGRHGDD
jgi:Cu(I)/Ag(I) efflux system membrane fusion protein